MNVVHVPQKNFELALFSLRITVALVLFMWSLDKLINPVHAAKVFTNFYAIDNLSSSISYVLGVLQLSIVFSFIVGFQKRWVTLLLLLMHLVSTLTSYERYMDPWSGTHLLFYTAWPMLAGMFILYYFRDFDTLFTVGKKQPVELNN